MQFKPIHPDFTGTFNVQASRGTYIVNLDTGTCECPSGEAIVYTDNKAAHKAYCAHKLNALAQITERDPDKYTYYYAKALATRYNVYETVSAFHKCVRRAAVDDAIYWGLVLSKFRGIRGVINYLLNIVYEETRDHQLHEKLLNLYERAGNGDSASLLATLCTAVRAFCVSPKKWELPHRYEIFMSEMRGYEMLAREFGWSVAKPKDIIAAEHTERLKGWMKAGIQEKDKVLFQRGLKGLLKSSSDVGYEGQKHLIYGWIDEYARYAPYDNRCVYGSIRTTIERRLKLVKNSLGYHELNALGDALLGEAIDCGFTPAEEECVYPDGFSPHISLRGLKQIPLYAHDNHTYRGKHAMRFHPEELLPGAKQVHLDFRWCGAYFGVAWRTQAFKQHGTVHVNWEDVTWDTELHTIVNKMWY